MPRPSVYEFAGGDPAFLALAEAHHERCLAEPEISHAFSHGFNPAHIENLAFYWAEVFGGPNRYSVRHGGHSGMLEMHARTGAAEDWGQRCRRGARGWGAGLRPNGKGPPEGGSGCGPAAPGGRRERRFRGGGGRGPEGPAPPARGTG